MKVLKVEEYFVYPQGVCRIRKPACAGNGCAIFPAFNTAQLGKKIRCSAEGDLFRVSLGFIVELRMILTRRTTAGRHGNAVCFHGKEGHHE